MATLLDSQIDSAVAFLGVKFYTQDYLEGDEILADLRQTVLDRLEVLGFFPDGVEVTAEVQA